EADAALARAIEATRALRTLRAELEVPANARLPLATYEGDLAGLEGIVTGQAKIESLVPGRPEGAFVSIHAAGTDLHLPTEGMDVAKILAVPSWTETQRGFQRVRWSCQARAVEHQTFVIHASLVGGFGYEPVPDSVGSSAIIAPSVEPFPVEAILAQSPYNEESLIVADLDMAMLDEARLRGEVRNWEDRDRGTWTVVDHRVDAVDGS
ncbi:hypothetical protein EON79_13610, partial [bacterium]